MLPPAPSNEDDGGDQGQRWQPLSASERLARVEEKQNTAAWRLGKIEEEVRKLDAKFESRMDGMEQVIDRKLAPLADLKRQVETMDNRLSEQGAVTGATKWLGSVVGPMVIGFVLMAILAAAFGVRPPDIGP